MNLQRLNLFAFLVSISAISYYHVKKCHELPWPPQFIYTALVFAMLGIVGMFNEEIGGVGSIGFVIGIILKQGFIADCNHQGTGQPTTVAYLGGSQPPSTASLQEWQQQTGQTSGTTGQGGNVVV
jgi:hypothetical protein